jgi:hypothetical protein
MNSSHEVDKSVLCSVAELMLETENGSKPSRAYTPASLFAGAAAVDAVVLLPVVRI